MQQGRASEKESIVKGFEISKEMMQSTTLAEAQKEQIKEQMSFFGKISADRNSYIDIYPLVGGNVLTVNAELEIMYIRVRFWLQ